MSKLDNLQNKLDMWQRTATMYGSINVTLTPSDVVQLHQDVAALYARIAKLESEQRWIPVGERLPKAYTQVLACSESGYMEVDYRFAEPIVDVGIAEFYSLDNVTHWMPLPARPEVQE